jgi:hypothetical protein
MMLEAQTTFFCLPPWQLNLSKMSSSYQAQSAFLVHIEKSLAAPALA